MTEKYRSLEHTIIAARKAHQIANMVFETQIDEIITNSNSSGQGYDDEHRNHEYHSTILKHGYNYSHSTPIRQRDGSQVNHHTYKHMSNQDKNVSVSRPPGTAGSHLQWTTSTSGGGRGTKTMSGFSDHTLDKHLKTRNVAKKTTPDDLGHREKLATEEVVLVEDIDTIDELSNKKLAPYMRKASKDLDFYHKQKINTITSDKELPKVDKKIENRQKGNGLALRKALKNSGMSLKDEVIEPVAEPIEELAPPDPNKAKMDAQRMQLQKQRDALRLQIQKQKADKEMQSAKQKGQQELQKIKETEELTERQSRRVHNFARASKLQSLHNRQYQRLSAAGNLAAAETHRKRAIEYKRISYMARDNPGKLPTA